MKGRGAKGIHLGQFLTFTLTGGGQSLFSISKGAIAVVEFSDRGLKGKGRLACLLQPSQLKKISKI